ncbi:hypothetical protein HYT92_02935 [Candidatus Pacearchaeota archaeon]|nr:hypothetical protein [Candidatus Pacearchaeota archaeon]
MYNFRKKVAEYLALGMTTLALGYAPLYAEDFKNGGEKLAVGLEGVAATPAEVPGMAGMVAREFGVDRNMGAPGALAGFGVGATAGVLRGIGRGISAAYNIATSPFSNRGEGVFTGNNLHSKIWNDYEDGSLAAEPTQTDTTPSKFDELRLR